MMLLFVVFRFGILNILCNEKFRMFFCGMFRLFCVVIVKCIGIGVLLLLIVIGIL